MSRPIYCLLAGLTGLAACSTFSGGPSNGAASNGASNGVSNGDGDNVVSARPGGSGQGAVAGAVDGSFEKPAQQQSEEGRKLDELIRSFWRDPALQRGFAESYLRGSEVDPAMTIREGELRTEVLELIAQEEYDNAISRLKGRQGDGVSAEIDYMLGNLYYGRDRYQDAEREFSIAVGKYPSFRRAWNNLAQVRMRLEDYRGAADAFVRVINLGGGDALTYGFLGLMHMRTADHVAAESAFRIAAMMEPSRVQWRVQLAETLLEQRRFGEAASLAGTLIEQSPDQAEYWLYQAKAYARMNETTRAAENLEVVDRLGGSTPATLNLLGNIYYNDGLFDMAADAYLRSMALDEKGEFRTAMLSARRLAARSAYAASEKLVQGIESAYAGRLDDAAQLELLQLRARFAAEAGATDEQVALLEQIVAKNPLDGAALIQLGRHYADEDEVDKAILRFEQAAEIERFAAEAKFVHGQLLASKARFAEAEPLLRASLNLKPRDAVQKLLEYVERSKARGSGKS